MNRAIKGKHTCATCRYRKGNKCGNIDSDYIGDMIGDGMWCHEWEKERRPEHLTNYDLLNQIAEECAELIQAIEKFRRCGSANPTPVDAPTAWINILEEVGDVQLTAEVFRRRLPEITNDSINEVMDAKYKRWCNRLND